MDNKFVEESFNINRTNANQNEIIDDEPYPPPGLNRVVPGQTVSFDDGLNSPPFARIVPGEGNDHTNTYQLFTSASKMTNAYGHNFSKDNNTYNSSKDFFDSYLHNALDNEPKSSQPPRSKLPNQFFPDADKRENYLQQNPPQLPPSNFDNTNNEKADVSFNNFHHRSTAALSKSVKENVQFEGNVQHLKPEAVPNFFQTLPDSDQSIESKGRSEFFQNNFNPSLEKNNEEVKNNLPSNRMAIEGSCDNGSYSKTISSSTPVQSPSYDFWYSNNSQSTFNDFAEVKNAHAEDTRPARDQNSTFYPKPRSTPPVQLPLNSQFPPAQNTLDPQHVHSKTPSISSNTSSLNEPPSYQPSENYNAELKRADHYNSVEQAEAGSGNFEIHTNNGIKANAERPSMQTFEKNRRNFEPDTKSNEQYQSETYRSRESKLEPPLGQRMVVGETSSDALPSRRSGKTRKDRQFSDEKSRRTGSDLLSGRNDKNKKMYESGRDRREVESGDEDYNTLDRSSHSYHDKHYRSSPRRFNKRLPRRPHENSITHSQDESYYDDDDYEDDEDNDNENHYPSYNRSHRKYYDRRPLRDSNYRLYSHDPFYRDDRKYKKLPDYYGYEQDPYYVSRGSRPSSRTGSELYRPLPHANQIFYPKGYEFLDHHQIVSYGAAIRMSDRDFEALSHFRLANPPEYMRWFKNVFPKEYADWYSRFYGMSRMTNSNYQADRRGSGHSGQSSVNNDVISVNDEKLPGMSDQLLFKPVETEAESSIQEARYSPSKYTIPHVKGVFNSLGQLLVVNACSPRDSQPADISIYSLLPPKNADWQEFLKCTGPFIVGETHVSTISDFVRKRASEARSSSENLLYLLIDLIIKLRGVTDGIAISELLMSSYHESGGILPNVKEEMTQSTINLSESEIIKEYTNLLLQGNKNSALEWAVNHKLWGHAFLLASKMGTKYYSNVLAKFDASISINNPLKTLYQLHSNQIPLAATACADEKWGDWRPHLAMILSNPMIENELDKTAIITLGDSLAHKDIYASHFCYLAAELNFDSPKSSSKLTLLTLHNSVDNFGITTPNHAILLTQMYEFAKRLQRKDYTISALLPFKYLLATRLVDYGRCHIALQYLESIALDLLKDTGEHNLDLMANVVELSERIKYSDLKPLVNDSNEKQWLANLKRVVDERRNQTSSDNSHLDRSHSDCPNRMPSFKLQPPTQPLLLPSQLPQQPQVYSPSNEVQSPLMYQQLSMSQPSSLLPTSASTQSWDNTTYSMNSLDISTPGGFPSSNQLQPQKSNESSLDVNDKTNDFNQSSSTDNYQNYYSPWDQPQQAATISMHSSNNYFGDKSKPNKTKAKHDVSKTCDSRNNPFPRCELVRSSTITHSLRKSHPSKRVRDKKSNFYSALSADIVSSASLRRGVRLAHALDKLLLGDDFASSYYHSLCNSKVIFNGTFPIDKPFAIRGSLRDTKSQLVKENTAQDRKTESRPSQQATNQEQEKNNDKKGEGNRGGWLGFLLRRPNVPEAKLPEDKKPTIIYDEEKKRWVDTEKTTGDDDVELKPPPPAAAFKNYPSANSEVPQRLDNTPSASNKPFMDYSKPPPAPSMTSSGNAYSLSRGKGKGMKANYVNILSENTTPTPHVNAFSNTQMPPNMNLFAPGSPDNNLPSMGDPDANRKPPDNAALPRNSQLPPLQFYNPAQYNRF